MLIIQETSNSQRFTRSLVVGIKGIILLRGTDCRYKKIHIFKTEKVLVAELFNNDYRGEFLNVNI